MTIKNISSKIISVGSTVLMPDASMKANKAVCEAPAVKALAEIDLITISDEAKAKSATGDKTKAEAEKTDAKAKTEAEKTTAQK